MRRVIFKALLPFRTARTKTRTYNMQTVKLCNLHDGYSDCRLTTQHHVSFDSVSVIDLFVLSPFFKTLVHELSHYRPLL